MSASNVVPFADNTKARRLTNRETADTLALVGVYVFQTVMKTPITPRFNRADDTLTVAEVEEAVEEFEQKHKYKPVQVGATRDPKKIKNMYRRNIDAMWSIACGPSKLVVIDADQKDGGPEKIAAHFEEHGLPEGCVVVPTQSGGRHYYFSDPDNKFTNSAGLLKSQYGCDVRGRGGQCVAPGSIRLEDGKTYGTKKHLLALRDAIRDGTLPELPDHIVELIGTHADAPEGDNVTPSKEREVIHELRDADWSVFENDFDGDVGKYDLDKLKAENAEFAKLYDEPTPDCSTNRFLAARHVMREWPDMPARSLSIFFSQWEGAGSYTDEKPKTGEYDDRQIAREWIKNQGLSKPSTGEEFADVSEATARDDAEYKKAIEGKDAEHSKRFVYIENIRGAMLRMLDWCIKFFVARGTTSVATGLWGAGKTAVFSDIGLHVGHGFEWRGRKVAKGVVIYVALENSDDVERRVAAWCDIMERAGRDLSGGAFVVHRGPCRLFDPNGKPTRDEKDLIEIANTAAAHYGLPVAMIVIDTLAQSIMPGNDNDAKDAGIFTAAMQRIVAATGANVTALAHPTKTGKEGVRGSGALQANVDTVIEVSRDAGGRGTIKAGSKFRIGNPAKVKFGYRLKSQVIGRDDDGDDIDVVLAVEDQTGPDLAVVDGEDEEVPLLKVPDRREDRVAMLLDVAREEAAKAAADGEPLGEVALMPVTIRDALNARRARFCGLDGKPLSPLNREGVNRVVATAIEQGGLVSRKSRYFVEA
jgi:hypothetical protein